jgi:hypothetical protein
MAANRWASGGLPRYVVPYRAQVHRKALCPKNCMGLVAKVMADARRLALQRHPNQNKG